MLRRTLEIDAGDRARSPLFGRGFVDDGLDDAVEDEFEGPVRLAAEEDLGPEQREPALSDPGVEDGEAPLEVLLAPRPAAAQRGPGVEPADAP